MKKSDVAYAVIRVGGQQFKVSAGDTIVVDRVDADEGKSITLDTLAVRTDSGQFDGDAAKHAKVKAKVDEHVLGKKIKVFTYKPKSTFKKTKGHRSRLDQADDRVDHPQAGEGEEGWRIRRAAAPAATAATPSHSVSASRRLPARSYPPDPSSSASAAPGSAPAKAPVSASTTRSSPR